ncbi:MAG: tRNA uridine-5-carboxymethylaminomethyl(34) synthesis GTPase MnmE [Clostridia bacterium]|nr:tRNA uridine-5-carboxymethylaminomethyl(34) synthesis GTPase MnmE [Clostridia bacterium]
MLLPPIAAVSTPFGKGAIALVRVSGEGCMEIVERIFRTKSALRPRFAAYGEVVDPENGEVVDDGILTFFEGPNSYTGEDSFEITCHGGAIVTARVLRTCLKAGARMAEPGEFTRRAFAAGKLTLSTAEGIADLIDARTDEAARLSRRAASGALSKKLDALSESVLALATSLAAVMDYPDEGIEDVGGEKLAEEIARLTQELHRLMSTLSTSRAVTEGIPAYIVGRFNVGKSSFFNALVGEERAIVTNIPGTTRDMIEYPISAGRLLLRLTDTAGLRDGADAIEQIGIGKTREKLESAEGKVVFALFDSSEAPHAEDLEQIAYLQTLSAACRIVPVLTKCDLARVFDANLLAPFGKVFEISVEGSCDFSALFSHLEEEYIRDEDALLRGEVLMNVRQYDCVRRAHEALTRAAGFLTEEDNDLCMTLLEEALSALREADGREVAGMVADEIFKRFCVGK